MPFLISIFTAVLFVSSQAYSLPTSISGPEILSGVQKKIDVTNKKGMVVIFLSALCPCSMSHVTELNSLADKYKDFAFIGVHSNVNETADQTTAYFKTAGIGFPVIQDSQAKLADQFKALKTPHVFLITNSGEIVYQGGVSNSRTFEKSDKHFLRDALEDMSNDHPVRVPEGRTLGCVISRSS